MSTRRENAALVERLSALIDDVAAHRKALHGADDHDAAEAWDDTLHALYRALDNAPECEDRP